MRRGIAVASLALALATLVSCSSAYYRAMETFGYEKRDLLVDRVGDARDAQQKAQQQFTDALEQFRSVVEYEGGNLEEAYDDLKGEYERSDQRASAVRERIRDVKKVADDLFDEWDDELDEYSDAKLRKKSQDQLTQTRKRYGKLVGKMDTAAGRMDPVLATMNDQVLFLKHNLNARALGSLEDTAIDLEADVDRLVRDMREAIAEADRFIATLEG